MRKLGIVALAAAALFAQGVRAEDAKDKVDKAASDTSGAARKEGQRVREAGDRAMHGSGPASDQKAEEAKSPMTGDAQNRTAQNTKVEKKHPLFDGKHNFDVDGKVQHASKDSITISREDLPPATLSVSHGTKVELDGNQVSVDQLKPGEDVKASFNLNKDKPEAVEIKAKRNK